MNFIEKYEKFANPLTEASRVFHNYMAYMILSQAIGRKVFYRGAGSFPLSPCLWVIIIGPSSRTKKTTTIRIATEYILKNAFGPDHEFVYPAEGSHESFIELLTMRPQGMVLHTEFANFMNWLSRDYNAALMPVLTHIYDQPAEYTRRVGTRDKAKTYTISRPYVNILACTTIEWLNDKLDEYKLKGGFFPRFILIPDAEHSKLIPETPEPDEKLQSELCMEAQDLINLPGEYQAVYTEDARKKYLDWYPKAKKIVWESSTLTQPFQDRRMSDVHKFAMIHACMRKEFRPPPENRPLDPGQLLMTEEDLERAIGIIEQFFEYNQQIINEDIALTYYEKERHKVLDVIKRLSSSNGNQKHGVPHWMLVKYSKIERRKLRDVIENLLDEKTIHQIDAGTGANGKKKIFYKLKKSEDDDNA